MPDTESQNHKNSRFLNQSVIHFVIFCAWNRQKIHKITFSLILGGFVFENVIVIVSKDTT